ncbi:MAG TPA: hypothetical protein VJA16_20735, partial [Thermoanaerobaculia bacterium]
LSYEIQPAALAGGHDDPAQGVEIAERALALVEPGREPRLELAVRHLLIWFLNDCGMSWQALDLLERSRPLYRGCGESEPLLLMPWLEARICRRLGQLGAAEDGLAEAWHRCRAAGCHQDLMLVSRCAAGGGGAAGGGAVLPAGLAAGGAVPGATLVGQGHSAPGIRR